MLCLFLQVTRWNILKCINGWLDTKFAVWSVIIEHISWGMDRWHRTHMLRGVPYQMHYNCKETYGCKCIRKPIQLSTSTQLKVKRHRLYFCHISHHSMVINNYYNSYRKLSVKELIHHRWVVFIPSIDKRTVLTTFSFWWYLKNG
jgi:hypothetical protein